MISNIKRGALCALAAVTFIHATTAAAAAPARPAPRTAPRYVPPPPPPPALNALPAFEISGYGGPGNFRAGDDNGSDSRGSTDFGFEASAIAANHLLLAVDYDNNRVSTDGGHFTFAPWHLGLGYIGPMGRTASWYAKASIASLRFSGCANGLGCDGTTQSGGGIAAGFRLPFAQQWIGDIDVAYDYLAKKDNSDAVNAVGIGGKLVCKITRAVGLWAGVHANFYTDADSSSNGAYVNVVEGRFGISVDVY